MLFFWFTRLVKTMYSIKYKKGVKIMGNKRKMYTYSQLLHLLLDVAFWEMLHISKLQVHFCQPHQDAVSGPFKVFSLTSKVLKKNIKDLNKRNSTKSKPLSPQHLYTSMPLFISNSAIFKSVRASSHSTTTSPQSIPACAFLKRFQILFFTVLGFSAFLMHFSPMF